MKERIILKKGKNIEKVHQETYESELEHLEQLLETRTTFAGDDLEQHERYKLKCIAELKEKYKITD